MKKNTRPRSKKLNKPIKDKIKDGTQRTEDPNIELNEYAGGPIRAIQKNKNTEHTKVILKIAIGKLVIQCSSVRTFSPMTIPIIAGPNIITSTLLIILIYL